MIKKYIKDEHYDEAIQIIKEYVNEFSNVKNLEIEVRLGYIEDGEFKTDIKKKFFDKIYNILSNSNVWSDIVKEKTTDYFYSGKRLSINEKKEEKCIKKEKLAIIDFSFLGSGFDVRVSFSKETPVSNFDIYKSDYIRKKNRISYNYKHLSYDLTEVVLEDNGVTDYLYEIEIEVKKLNLKKMSSHYLVHDILLKITDIVKMCEEIDEDFKIELYNEKVF